jgi:hypothetical protein
MKKGNKIGLLSITSLLIISFLINLVNAETLFKKIIGGGGFFSGVDWSFLSSFGFNKFLLYILVFLIIYSIVEFLPFLSERTWVGVLASIIISFLSVNAMNAQDVTAILLSYTAMGFILTTILPFIVIATISKKLHERGLGYWGRIMWIGFLIFLVIRLFTLDVDDPNIGYRAVTFYGLTALAALIMFLFENWIYLKIFVAARKGDVEAYEGFSKVVISNRIKELEKAKETASDAEEKRLEEEIDKLKKRL